MNENGHLNNFVRDILDSLLVLYDKQLNCMSYFWVMSTNIFGQGLITTWRIIRSHTNVSLVALIFITHCHNLVKIEFLVNDEFLKIAQNQHHEECSLYSNITIKIL